MMKTATHRDVRRRVELTGRQREVMELLAHGYTNAEIGAALGISLDGAKWHVSEIIGKLAVSSREEAVAFWREYRSPGARLSRALHSLATLGTVRWAAGVTGLAAAAGVSVIAIAAIVNGGGSDTLAAPDATPTATAPPSATPSPSPTAQPAVTPTTAPAVAPGGDTEARTPLDVYFLHGEDLAPVRREVPQTLAVGRAALEQLFAGPDADDEGIGLSTAVPDGVRLLGLDISDGIATVDLSGAFEAGGGSLSMQMRLAQVVYTLTQFPTVDAVVFQVDGETVEVFGGEGIVLDGPVDRADFEDVTQAIVVESPANWESVTSPVRITGTANTFEATFWVNVVDAEGRVVAESVVTATSGTGERGTFDITVPFEVNRPGLGSIIVFEYSARDGSPVNISETRVVLGE